MDPVYIDQYFGDLKYILEGGSKKINEPKFSIDSYIEAIDLRSTEKIKQLIEKDKYLIKNNDIVYEIYQKNLLNVERLKFITENCNHYLSISTKLIKRLIQNDRFELLDNIFSSYKFFNNDFILQLLFNYKNKIPVSKKNLIQQIEKYEFQTYNKFNYYKFTKFRSTKYLIAAFRIGTISAVKYFINLGVNINGINSHGETPLHYACQYGNEAMIKCLVENGAEINQRSNNGITPLFIACEYGNEGM
eukprot:jgi/Orpsp1_1/1189829/evm.model.d7180000074797.1